MKRKKDLVIICRCEEVTYNDVIKAVKEGYTTLEEIKRHLRCGMGACQGRSCMPLIARIVRKQTTSSTSELVFPTTRPPLRPVPFAVLARGKMKNE